MKHTISVLLQNKPGVLSRVTGLFSGRGFNIESLSVNQTLEPEISCLTLVTKGDDSIVEQITKQLHKLIDVIKVTDMCEHEYVEREMVLIRVKAEAHTRAEVLRVITNAVHWAAPTTGPELRFGQHPDPLEQIRSAE